MFMIAKAYYPTKTSHFLNVCCESGSVRIQNFLRDPDPDTDPSLEVMDSDLDPKQEMRPIKNHQNTLKMLFLLLGLSTREYLGSDP
jgi:hypothetical protein